MKDGGEIDNERSRLDVEDTKSLMNLLLSVSVVGVV